MASNKHNKTVQTMLAEFWQKSQRKNIRKLRTTKLPRSSTVFALIEGHETDEIFCSRTIERKPFRLS